MYTFTSICYNSRDMDSIVLAQESLLAMALSDGGLILFGVLLVLLGVATGLVFLLASQFSVVKPLVAIDLVVLILLIAIITLDLSNANGSYYTFAHTRSLSELLSTHRWLVIQLPVLLMVVSLCILLTYDRHLQKSAMTHDHARYYRYIIQTSTCITLATMLLIALESLL